MAQSPWYGHHNTHEHHDDRKDDRAQRVIRQGVEDLGTGKDVEADENNVVGEQHEPRECIGNSALSKGVVSKITYCHQFGGAREAFIRPNGRTNIHDLRMLHDELVHGHGCDPEEDTSDDHGDNSGDPS